MMNTAWQNILAIIIHRKKENVKGSVKKLGLETHGLDLLIEDVKEEINKMEEQGFFA